MKIKPLIPSLLTLLAGSLNFATAATLSTPKHPETESAGLIIAKEKNSSIDSISTNTDHSGIISTAFDKEVFGVYHSESEKSNNTPPIGLGTGEYGFNYFRVRAVQAGSTTDVDNIKVVDSDTNETVYWNDFSSHTEGLSLKHNPVANLRNERKGNFTWSTEDEVEKDSLIRISNNKLRLETIGFNRNGAGGYNSYSYLVSDDRLPANFELTFKANRKQWAGHQHFHILSSKNVDDEEWHKDPESTVFRSIMGGTKLRDAQVAGKDGKLSSIRTGAHVVYPNFNYKLIKKGPKLEYFVNGVLLGQTNSLTRINDTLEIESHAMIGTKVASFDAYDEDADDLTYHLVEGEGDKHNHYFKLDTDGTLKTARRLNLQNLGSTLEIRLQADDGNGGTIEEKFQIALTESNEDRPTPPPAPGTGGLTPPDPDYKDTIAELKRLLAEKDKKLAHCETEMAAKEKQIGELTATNEKLQGEVKALKGKVTGLETEVASLKTDNEGLKGQIQNLREDNQNLNYELTVTNEHLEEAIKVAETPFINGWVYDPVRGWLFTDAEHFPLVYTHNDQSWNYYELGSSNPRYFYNYTTQEWVAWDAQPEEAEQTVAINSNF